MTLNRTRIGRRRFAYLLFTLFAFVGLTWGTATTSSSRLQKRETLNGADLAGYRVQHLPLPTAASAPSLSDASRLLFQAPTQATAKISAQVLADTAAGKNSSVVILLADQADVSGAETI